MAVNAAQLEIDIKVDGAASAERDIRGVGNAVDDTGKKMSAAGSQTSTFGKAFQSVGPLAVAGFAGAGAAAVKFGADSFNAFVGFQKQMNEVFSLMPGISQQAMGEMTEQVKSFSREFGVLPEKVVPALYEALSSGVPQDNVFDFLATAQKAAIGGVTDVQTTVNGLTSVINAYGSDVISAGQASDIMFTAVKLGKCILGSMRVLQADGSYRRIDEMQDGGTVVAYDGRAFLPMRAQWIDQGVKPTVKLRTRLGREIVTTWTHPYLTKVQEQDYRSNQPPQWRPVSELRVGDSIAIPTAIPFFGTTVVPEHEAAFLGLWLAEGRSEDGSPCITSTAYGEQIMAWAESFGCEARNIERREGRAPTYCIVGGRRNGGRTPSGAQTFLRGLGFNGTTAGEKHIPDSAFTWDRRSLRIMLHWLFNGDGWLADLRPTGRSGFQVGFVSKSERLVRDVSHLLLRFGIVGRVRQRQNAWVWETNRYSEVRRFVEIVGIDRPAVADVLAHEPEKQKANRGVVEFDPIVAIEAGPDEHVYDLTVEELHNFVAEDIIAHNTTFDELSNSLFNVNPVAAALGVKFSDVAAGLAAMTAQGIPTSVATTQLRQMFVELSDSGSGLAKTFQQLTGQTFKEFIAGGGNLQQALQIIEQHAQSTGVGINDLFGSVEAGSAALALTGKGTEAFTNALTEMDNSSGSTEQAFNQMQSGISADIDRMKANFATFQLTVGEKLAGAAVAIVDADLGAKLVDSIQGGLSAAGDLMGKGKELIDGIISGAKDAWESGKEFFTGLGQSAVDAVGDLASTLTDTGSALLKGLEDGAHTAWDTAAGWLGQRGSDAVSAVGNLGSTLLDAGTALLTGLKNGAETVWNTVDGWLGGRGSAAVAAIGDLGGTLVAAGTALLTGLKNGAESGWGEVAGFLGGIAGKAVAAVGNLGSALVGAGASLIGGLVSGIRSAIPDLDGILSSITSRIPNLKGPPVKDAMLLYPNGQLIMQGLGEGLLDGFDRYVAPALAQATARVTSAAERIGSGPPRPPSGSPFGNPYAFAAYVAGDRSPGAVSGYAAGLQYQAAGFAAYDAYLEQQRRYEQSLRLSAEKQRFAAWMRQQGRGYEIDTMGVDAAWRAYYQGKTGPYEMDPGPMGDNYWRAILGANGITDLGGPFVGQPSRTVTVVLNVDGRQLAQVVTPLISGQMAANVKGMGGG